MTSNEAYRELGRMLNRIRDCDSIMTSGRWVQDNDRITALMQSGVWQDLMQSTDCRPECKGVYDDLLGIALLRNSLGELTAVMEEVMKVLMVINKWKEDQLFGKS